MKDLDNPKSIKKFDKSDMRKILMDFPHQYKEATKLAEEFKDKIPDSFRQVSNIVISGMGGSAIGGDLLRSLFSEKCPVPIIVNRNYSVPEFVSKETLFIAVSYSGNTEETISAFKHAVARCAKVISISSGGELEKLSNDAGLTHFPIPVKGIQPRCAFGYLFVPMVVFLSKLGFIPDQAQDLEELSAILSKTSANLSPDIPTKGNYAKQLAVALRNKLPVIYAPQDLDAVAMRWKGQFNENSKMMAFYNVIPEMNHNEIVGWGIPKRLSRRCVVIMLGCDDDPPKIKKRMDVTKCLIAKEGVQVRDVQAQGNSPLTRALYLIYLGDFVSYYLAILNGIDPTPVERIRILKLKLQESKSNSPAL